jgi:hypothetical protein
MNVKDQLTEGIRAAANYLIRRCGESGQFEYRVNLDPRVTVKAKYNLVRHAGAICALAWYSDLMRNDAARPAIGRAVEFLRANIAPVSHSPLRHAVWSRREIEGRGRRTQCKLGATGLALVALGLAQKVDSQFVSSSELTALAEFVFFMQKSTGQYYSKYFPGRDRRSAKWTSLYYPGEATLGLLVAYQIGADRRWLAAAERGLHYLAKHRRGRFPVEPDHWALMATAEYLRIHQVADGRPTSQDLLQHAIQICESMLHEQVCSGGSAENCGWFTADRRTTPTATRIEGLLAALRFLPDSLQDLRHRMVIGVVRGIQFLLRSQIQDGPFAGSVPREPYVAAIHEVGRGVGRSRAMEIRIDYVQHALCAMLHFRELRFFLESLASTAAPAAFGVCQLDVGLS